MESVYDDNHKDDDDDERHHGQESWSERGTDDVSLAAIAANKNKRGVNWDTSHAADAPATTMRDRQNVREMPQVGTQHE